MSIKPKYDVGRTYGNVTVLAISREKYFRYQCRCALCGKEFFTQGGAFCEDGCPKCRAKAKDAQRVRELSEKYAGQKYGAFTIKRVVKARKADTQGNHKFMAVCECSQCGKVSMRPLTVVINGRILRCACGRKKGLDAGRDAVEEARIEGTMIHAIKPERAINSNNRSGVKGVCQIKGRIGYQWRAYINVAGKQYHLGVFDNFQDAVYARKVAEEEAFGSIIKKWKEEKDKKI